MPGSVHSFVSSRRNKLTELRFWHEADVPAEWDAHKQEHGRSLLDVCAAYSSVVDLALDLRYYSSLSHLHQYLCHFPKLSCLRLQGAISPYVEPATTADIAPAYSVGVPTLSLSTFELSDVRMPWASQLLELVSTQRACSHLNNMLFAFRNSSPSPELVARITEVLRLAGSGLKTLRWRGDLTEDEIHKGFPQLGASTSLTGLVVELRRVISTLPRIQRVLSTLLNDIKSPHLERLHIKIYLFHYEMFQHGSELAETAPPDSTSAFHNILSRSVFDTLPVSAAAAVASQSYADVCVELVMEGSQQSAAPMSTIKAYMIALFAPWLDRGVLQLRAFPDPDGEWSVTRVPSSVTSETHGSITEVRDSQDIEHGGGARNVSGDAEIEEARISVA